jgi:hypothetical protein
MAEHANYMRKQDSYGTNLELIALADAQNLRINVFKHDGASQRLVLNPNNIFVPRDGANGATRTVHVLQTGDQDAGGHYTALLKYEKDLPPASARGFGGKRIFFKKK